MREMALSLSERFNWVKQRVKRVFFSQHLDYFLFFSAA